MITNNMSLRKMIEFRPDDADMAMLPLDVVVYIKASIVSSDKNTNYDFIRYLFKDENMSYYFKDLNKTIFYDFDGRNSGQEKVVTIFELYSLFNYENTSNYLQELLMYYNHEADVLIDLYTHDSKEYRLSNLDGIVKLEQMNVKN
ncbi:MAG: hypothetical protein IJH00_05400 [Erysipelotrichaceae bacterium]|nr:hypothetical protein [Erysipelotrichaceae bacterium]